MNSFKKPLVLGHRGAKGEAPENTLASFQLAVEQGSDGVELDVHLSKDGHLVVIHDSTVDRTTNGTGKVRDMTLEELKQLDAGSWFDEKFAGEKIPTLDEVLDLFPDDFLVNVEVKAGESDDLGEKLIQSLNARGNLDRFVVSSFDHKCLKSIKLAEPRFKIGLLYSHNIIDPVGYSKLMGVDVYSIHPLAKWITAEEVKQAEDLGMPIYTYTINSEEGTLVAMEKRIDAIITDYPALLRKVIDEAEAAQ